MIAQGDYSILDFRFEILDFVVLDAETVFFYENTVFEPLTLVKNPVSLVFMRLGLFWLQPFDILPQYRWESVKTFLFFYQSAP
jgi:hypothetical protein